MANVFTRSNNMTPKPNRNTFDGSFTNNLTLKMGQITPCFLKEVVPGDSFKIDATFGFNFQPFVFPVQTEMQANLHFFYVRNRALWNGWQDFITKTENLEGDSTPPYIYLTEENRDMIDTGKIGDYLGIPTIYYGSESVVRNADFQTYNDGELVDRSSTYLAANEFFDFPLASSDVDTDTELASWLENLNERIKNGIFSPAGSPADEKYQFIYTPYIGDRTRTPFAAYEFYPRLTMLLLHISNFHQNIGRLLVESNVFPISEIPDVHTGAAPKVIPYDASFVLWSQKQNKALAVHSVKGTLNATAFDGQVLFSDVASEDIVNYNFINTGGYRTVDPEVLKANYDDNTLVGFVITQGLGCAIPDNTVSTFEHSEIRPLFAYYNESVGIPNNLRKLEYVPFANIENPDGIRISALPFRAVEACYNAFYRDDRNNPLIIDGKPYYNVFAQNKQGGADTTHYHLYQRNWESDVFTSAVQSPQQGVAPLVGVTASGQMTFADEEGKTYYLQAEFGDDGHTITGIKSYSSDMPVGTLRAMVDTISTGISINDFRNVNALQRWLETNMRKGLRYKDQIEAHFGTSPTYSELDMPEFIGGMSRRVKVNKVVQTSADTPGSPMGTLAGSASILGGEGQPITQYCDEHGWIIGFITITPKPVYSQHLSKQLLKTELLDYYFPEFAHIGFQPILNQEIAPLQCDEDSEGDRLHDVFGYQRAWYEYLANVDEVHGDFRTSLKDYIIHRVFDSVPKLGVEFLTVSQDEANEVFASTDKDSDKIFGQIIFDVKMKRPLPAIGVPKLEVG